VFAPKSRSVALRERRAERRACELLRSVIGEEGYAMYRELGFLRVPGGQGEDPGYSYLLYPHRPIVAFDEASGELLSEYCVGFPDRSDADPRLPDADDMLARWMALKGDERGLLADANLHPPGRRLDPGQLRRDLRRLQHWEARADG
jgi:hypothetical protein